MSGQGSSFVPPTPVGEPYRADGSDPPPFGVGDVAPRPFGPPTGHPPSHSFHGAAPGRGAQPTFTQPAHVPGAQLGPDARLARWALRIGVVSILVFNIPLGPIAMALGYSAMRRGEERAGKIAMLLGGIGTLIGIVAFVLLATGVMPPADELLETLRQDLNQR